jgi:hypothetical protein
MGMFTHCILQKLQTRFMTASNVILLSVLLGKGGGGRDTYHDHRRWITLI